MATDPTPHKTRSLRWRPFLTTLLMMGLVNCSIEGRVQNVDKNIDKMAAEIARLTDAIVKLQQLADAGFKLIVERLLKETPPAPTPDIDDIINGPKPTPSSAPSDRPSELTSGNHL